MREWLAGLVGENLAPIVSVVLSAAIVLLLALAIIGSAKRVFAGSGGIGGRSRAPRLAILDVTTVDTKRKLVLVRRDDTEHLLLIGGQNDLLVEGGIQRVRTRRVEPAASGRIEPEPVADTPAPLPQRRVPVATPMAPAPRTAPPVAVEPVSAPPQPAAPTPRAVTPSPAREAVRELTPEPMDLRVPPSSRALAQEVPAPQPGERQPPARSPGDTAPTGHGATVPPLPAFLGVLANRAPAAVPAPRTAPPAQPMPPQPPKPAPRAATETIDDEPKTDAVASLQAAPVATPQPPIQPRSMATPTLPQQSQVVASPATPPPEEARREEVRRDEPLRDEPQAPLVLTDEPLLPTEDTAPLVRPNGTRDGDGDAAAPRPAPEPVATPERQPLSVRSFATTIQARRPTTTPVAPVSAPAAPTIEPPRASSPEPRSEAPRSEAQRTSPTPTTEAAPPERQLTLEEEMERLLHDFTLDVGDRR